MHGRREEGGPVGEAKNGQERRLLRKRLAGRKHFQLPYRHLQQAMVAGSALACPRKLWHTGLLSENCLCWSMAIRSLMLALLIDVPLKKHIDQMLGDLSAGPFWKQTQAVQVVSKMD